MSNVTTLEIANAQLKLGEIISATNREQIILDNKKKEVKEMTRIEEALNKSIEGLKDEQKIFEAFVISAKEKHSAIINKLNDEKLEKQGLLDNLTEKIDETSKNLLGIQKDYEKKVKELNKLYEQEELKLKERLNLSIVEQTKLDNEILDKKKSIGELQIKIDGIDKVLATKQIEEGKLNKVISEVISNTINRDSLESDIKSYKEEAKQSKIDRDNINKEIEELNKLKSNLKIEVEGLESEKQVFIKTKFIFAQEKQAILQKEERLKFLAEQAGVKF